MSLDGKTSSEEREIGRPVPELYAALTEFALAKEQSSLALHQGLWSPDTKTIPEGLARANRTLVEGCRLGPGRHVLDSGCGVGATAITLAETHGVRVTGLTNCEPHVAAATEQAERRGVGHLVDFRYGDFMNLPFPDGSFDAVLNLESFSYARDKSAYLEGVHRVLRPGGRWRAIDVLRRNAVRTDEPGAEAQEALVSTVRRGWRLPPFILWRELNAMLEEAGFTAIVNRDLTAEALPWRKDNRRKVLSFLFLNPGVKETHPVIAEFLDASVCFAQALADGVLSYNFYSATRPDRSSRHPAASCGGERD